MTARCALVVLVAACGDPAAHVELVNITPLSCGKPPGATQLRVIAYTSTIEQRRPVPLGAPVELDGFPGDTTQLGVEVLGDAGAVLATGKSAPLAFGALGDGVAIPVFMAPPGGFCKTGGLVEARAAPSVVRAGAGVLVVGGDDAAGRPLSTAEYYDPAHATFVEVAVPSSLADPTNGLHGVALAELPDGRVLVTGTASHAVTMFDPATGAFTAPALFEHRAFHAAIAPDADHVLVAGGCADVVGGACSGPALHTSFDYTVADLTMRDPGPVLASSRIGGQLFDVGISADGVRRFVLADGTATADRFALTGNAQTVTGLHAQVAPLDGDALLSAYEPDGMVQTGAAGVVPPDGGAAVPIATAPVLDGARLALLEDGSVAAIGGDPRVARYLPTTNGWIQAAPPADGDAPGVLAAPALIRLDDGSLLVLGAAPATADAWIYRPSLVGPQSDKVDVFPDGSDGVLTPSDPSLVSRTGGKLALSGAALVGGPRMTTGSIAASVTVGTGGIALIAQQVGPGRALVGSLVPGSAASVARVDGGKTTPLCTGQIVSGFAGSTAVSLGVSGGTATLAIAGAPVATCDLSRDPDASDRGAWGLAAIAGQLDVETITVVRQ